jgi:hypothetical protein
MTTQIPNFSLEDQFGIRHAPPSLFANRPVLIVGGAQRRSEERIAAWAAEVKRAHPGRVDVFGLVDLHRVPFFLPKSVIRKHLKQKCPDLAVLCDWNGKVYRSLGLPREETGAVLFDHEGRLVEQLTGEINDDRLATLGPALARV